MQKCTATKKIPALSLLFAICDRSFVLMSQRHFDLIVFGGGNAITTAIECGKAGMKVALIERGPLGGTCPHRGCIPSKLLIGYADAAESVRQAVKFGFETT